MLPLIADDRKDEAIKLQRDELLRQQRELAELRDWKCQFDCGWLQFFCWLLYKSTISTLAEIWPLNYVLPQNKTFAGFRGW